jgi:DNA-binding MarR family transcriptional regulator
LDTNLGFKHRFPFLLGRTRCLDTLALFQSYFYLVIDAQTDPHTLADGLFAVMASVRRTARRRARRPADLSSLTAAQLELVRLVRHRPGLSVAEAAAELNLAPNTVSTLVGELADRRLLDRLVDPSDRRVARLELPHAVRRQMEAWRDRRVELLASAIDRLGEDRRVLEDALAVMRRLAVLFEEDDGSDGDVGSAGKPPAQKRVTR